MSRIYNRGLQTLAWLGEIGNRNDYEQRNYYKIPTDYINDSRRLTQSVNKFV